MSSKHEQPQDRCAIILRFMREHGGDSEVLRAFESELQEASTGRDFSALRAIERELGQWSRVMPQQLRRALDKELAEHLHASLNKPPGEELRRILSRGLIADDDEFRAVTAALADRPPSGFGPVDLERLSTMLRAYERVD